MNQSNPNQTPFSQLHISEPICRALEEMGFSSATDIQAQSIPLLLEGRDLIGRSQTGTGKTMAFGIPAVEAVEPQEHRGQPQILILCPTRELAMQACAEIRKVSRYKPGIRALEIYGGASMTHQIAGLRNGVNIVVGTPGRVMDHMRRGTLNLEHLKMVILDEADEMLNMGFKEDIETILQDTPDSRQTVLFSATMPAPILALTKKYQRDPQMIEIDRKQPSVKAIQQLCYEVPMGRKMDALNFLLRYYHPQLSLIFCNTKAMADEISEYLNRQGFHAEALHGDMKQQQRTQALNAFKNRRTNILVATDVAARGIDVENIDYVINYDLPQNAEYYIHRIGRTGRAGKSGCAITICSGRRQVFLMQQIARLVKSDVSFPAIPSCREINERQSQFRQQQMEEFLSSNPDLGYQSFLSSLEEKGFSSRQIAAALLELHFGKENAFQMEEIRPERTEFRRRDGDSHMAKVSISIGRSHRVAPNHIVGAITELTNLSGKDIGKIEIYDNRTVVAIPRAEMDDVISHMKRCKILGQPVTTEEYFPRGGSRGARGDFSSDSGRGHSRRSFGTAGRNHSRAYSDREPRHAKDYRRLESKKSFGSKRSSGKAFSE